MTNKLFLGIDGGGTKTSVYISDNNGNKLLSKKYEQGNYQILDKFTLMTEHLFSDMAQIKNETGIDEIVIYGGFAGVAGVPDAKEGIEKLFLNIADKYNIKIVKNTIIPDSQLVLEYNFPEKAGIILICGTGSVCLGKDNNGNIFRTGGFGHMIDDIGSGYWLGKETIRLGLYSQYHYNEKTPIENLLKEHLKTDNLDDSVNIIYGENNKKNTANLVPVLFKAYELGCEKAKKTIEYGVKQLVYYVENCFHLIGKSSNEVVLHGGIVKNIPVIKESLQKLLPFIKFTPDLNEPAKAACELGRKLFDELKR